MRKLKNVVLLLLAFLLLHGVAMAQGVDKTGEDVPSQGAQIGNESASKVTLAVEGGSLRVGIPEGFQLQREEAAEGELFPQRYLFINPDRGGEAHRPQPFKLAPVPTASDGQAP